MDARHLPFFISDMAKKENEFQQIQQLGFRALIDRFKSFSGTKHKSVLKGIGDDASVIKTEKAERLCTTSELFLEGVHFDLTYTPFHHLGYKIVTAAVSDIYAMNAVPQQILIDLAIPNKYSVQMMEQLYQGIDAAASDYGIQVTGGDTTASHQMLAISVTATGSAPEENLIYRDGAREGDIICVTGDLGGALAGLRILLREKKAWQESGEQHFQPDLENYQTVVERQLVPKARKDFVEGLAESRMRPTALMDLTQGLMADIREIAMQSGLGAEVYSPAIPIAMETRRVADEMNEDVDKYAFYGGEDFEMLFTLPEPLVEKFKADFDDFVVIGKMTDNKGKLKINTGEENDYEVDL